jgi:YfiH family protein
VTGRLDDPAANSAARELSAAVLQSPLLAQLPWLPHGITRRIIGLGHADGNVGYGAPRDQADAWAMRQLWAKAIGVQPENLVTIGQVHGTDVIPVTAVEAGRGAMPGAGPLAYGDGLMTNEAGPVLMTLHADCQPILLADPVRRAIAVVHAGWRGTVADITGATVHTMTRRYGTDPSDVLAFLGPTIERDCYEVGPEVAAAWLALAPGNDPAVIRPGNGDRYFFGVNEANTRRLIAAGVLEEHIEESGICTRCCGAEWFSHRGQGPNTGRFGAMMAIVAPEES